METKPRYIDAYPGFAASFANRHGKPRLDDQRVLSGIVFVNRNGLRWRDAPSACGPCKTMCNR